MLISIVQEVQSRLTIPKRTYNFLNVDPKLIERVQELWRTGLNTREIAEKVGKSRPTICLYLKYRTDVNALSRPKRKFSLNENFFSAIDTPEKAYWLGFLLGDGNISRTTVRTVLQGRDGHHLETFAENVKYDGPVKCWVQKYKNGKSFPRTSLILCSRRMVDDLMKMGWDDFKRKGDTRIVESVPREFLQPLMRGMFDADGCLTYSGKSALFLFVDAHASVVTWYRDQLVRELDRSEVKVRTSNRKQTCWVFHYGGNLQVKKILEWLYQGGGPSLRRKRDKAKKVMGV